MVNRLTEDQINEICMFLRVVDLMKKNKELVDENPQMKEEVEKMTIMVKGIMDELTDEERDEVLEIHKIQAEAIEKEVAGKLRKKKKNKN